MKWNAHADCLEEVTTIFKVKLRVLVPLNLSKNPCLCHWNPSPLLRILDPPLNWYLPKMDIDAYYLRHNPYYAGFEHNLSGPIVASNGKVSNCTRHSRVLFTLPDKCLRNTMLSVSHTWLSYYHFNLVALKLHYWENAIQRFPIHKQAYSLRF